MDNERVRPQHEYRVVKTEVGEMGMCLCSPHSSALTISIERERQAAKPISRNAMILFEETGEPTVKEVH